MAIDRETRFRVAAALLVLSCWLSAGAEPLWSAARGARDPVDFARDYVTARARLEDGRGPPLEGPDANVRARIYGAPEAVLLGAYYHAHPPPARLPVRPLGLLPWRAAALVWAAGSLLALGWLAFSLCALAGRGPAPGLRPGLLAVAAVTIALALWPPVLHCLEKGQWSILLAALLAAGLRALVGTRPRPRLAGLLFGLAAAIKATPLVLLGILLVRERRAARAMVATLALALVATVAIDGVEPWISFFSGAAQNAAAWASWTANTASLAGVIARLFDGGSFEGVAFARPIVHAPALAQVLFNAAAAAILGSAIWALRRRPAEPLTAPAGVSPAAALFAAWSTLPVLLNPLGWSHVLVMLLAPLVVAIRGGSAGARPLLLAVFAVLSIPRQTLDLLAGPHPVSPGRGLALGLHAFTGLALYVTLIVSHGPTRGPSSHAS